MRAERQSRRRARGPSLGERLSGLWRVLVRLSALAMALVALVGAVAGSRLLYEKMDVPIGLIGVDGELAHIAPKELEAIVAAELNGGFLSLDLDAVRVALEAHPWVARASARRVWPDQLMLVIEEETPIARWGGDGFLNNRGQMLAIDSLEGLDNLPLLAGPEGQSRDIMQQYRNFAQMLQAASLRIDEFRLGHRGDWSLEFAQGPSLVVGRGEVTEKIQRFLQVWKQHLRERVDEIDSIDIRYGNGVAVAWKDNDKA